MGVSAQTEVQALISRLDHIINELIDVGNCVGEFRGVYSQCCVHALNEAAEKYKKVRRHLSNLDYNIFAKGFGDNG